MDVCVAKANVLRCVGCFLFPFAALAAYVYKAASVGMHDLQSYLTALEGGGLVPASAVIFLGGSVAWIWVTWPKARAALRSGQCAIRVSPQWLDLYGDRIDRSDVSDVAVVRRPFDYQLQVSRRDGARLWKSITLLSPSPDAILTRLREQGY